MSALVLVTAPIGEPIAVADVKAYAHIDTPDDDLVVADMITAARQHFDGRDGWFGRALLTQTWELSLSRFPTTCDRPDDLKFGIPIPLPPLQSVTSIKYIDPQGVEQTLAPSAYEVDTKSEPGRVVPVAGTVWPTTKDTVNPVTVRFVAGYGARAQVPKAIRDWLKQAVTYLYVHREAPVLPDDFFWGLADYKASWNL